MTPRFVCGQAMRLRRRGSVLTDYALILGVVAAGMIATVSFAALAIEHPFTAVYRQMGSTAQESGSARTSRRVTAGPSGSFQQTDPSYRSYALRVVPLVVGTCASITALLVGIALLRPSRIRRRHSEGGTLAQEDSPVPVAPGQRDLLFEKRQAIARIFSQKMAGEPKQQLPVRYLMSRNLVTTRSKMPVEKVAGLMESGRVRHVLVCSSSGRLLGIISDRDLPGRGGRTAADLMTPRPLTIPPDMAIDTAVTIMVNKHISCLPVVADESVVGVLTSTDVMLSLQSSLRILAGLAGDQGTASNASAQATATSDAECR